MRCLLVFCLLAASCCAKTVRQERRFPDDFLFGTATAAYQIEGGWDADGKGENIWDYMTHNTPEVIVDMSNGDIAADSYNNYKRDVEMMRELGIDVYRFSFSWARILPEGFTNNINEAGIQFYNNYIDEMIKYNIIPMGTLYHWDLPQKLQELGGFQNPLIADWFADYSRVIYDRFGDRIKHFITFNEPREICYEGYASITKAPRLNATGTGAYRCAKNIVLAHAKAYHVYNDEFKAAQGGECGITISVAWHGPETDSAEDEFAAELIRQAEWGQYAHPIFSEEGGFPQALAERVAQKSAEQGFEWSRMPSFTQEEIKYIRGSSDFFGVNHYSGSYVSATNYKSQQLEPSVYGDIDVGQYAPEEWLASASSWLKLMPNSIYYALTHLNNRYPNTKFYITENGWSQLTPGDIYDDDRVLYYRLALESVLDTLEAGVNLKGYMAWSLMDNFEWMQGYKERFGLYRVDFDDPARTRTPRKSAFIYKHIVKNRYIDHDYEPESLTMTIDE